MAKKAVSCGGAAQRDPTPTEWRALLAFVSDEYPAVELTVRLLLVSTRSGQELVAGAKRLRPSLDVSGPLDEITLTYDAAELLDRLLAEPRFGTDPEFFIWMDIWRDETIGPSPLYDLVIEMATMRETDATDEPARQRLRVVREAVERELAGEKYIEQKSRLLRTKT